MHTFRTLAAAVLAVGAITLAGCAGNTDTPGGAGGDGSAASPDTVTIGYFPNMTHAPAIVGLADGTFQEALGDDVTITADDLYDAIRRHEHLIKLGALAAYRTRMQKS